MSSTSSPSTNSTSPGKCVVCGTETWMRCSACSKAGLDWMCFCSIEHQKLIWFLHKRVCGERSNPFRFPGFTAKEIDEMMAYSDKPFPVEWSSGTETWQTMVQCIWGDAYAPRSNSAHEREAILRRLLKAHEEKVSDFSDGSLTLVRTNAFRFRFASIQFRGVDWDQAKREAFVADPFSYMVDAEEHHLPRFSWGTLQYSTWWTEFQHLQLHVLALLSRLITSSTLDHHVEVMKCFIYTHVRFETFLSEIVAKDSPHIAKIFSGAMEDDLKIASMKEGSNGENKPKVVFEVTKALA